MNGAFAFFRRVGKLPDVAIAFQDQVITRRHFFQFRPGDIVGMGNVPNRPKGRVFRTQPPKRGSLYAHTFGGAQLIVSGYSIQHPNMVDVIMLVRIIVIGIERVRIELHIGFRFRRGHDGFLKTFHARLFFGLFSIIARPVIRIAGDTHDQFFWRHQFCYRLNIFYEPVLRGDGTGRGRAPVLIVVHQDNGIRGFADARIVVHPICSGEAHHQLQVCIVQDAG